MRSTFNFGLLLHRIYDSSFMLTILQSICCAHPSQKNYNCCTVHFAISQKKNNNNLRLLHFMNCAWPVCAIRHKYALITCSLSDSLRSPCKYSGTYIIKQVSLLKVWIQLTLLSHTYLYNRLHISHATYA